MESIANKHPHLSSFQLRFKHGILSPDSTLWRICKNCKNSRTRMIAKVPDDADSFISDFPTSRDESSKLWWMVCGIYWIGVVSYQPCYLLLLCHHFIMHSAWSRKFLLQTDITPKDICIQNMLQSVVIRLIIMYQKLWN